MDHQAELDRLAQSRQAFAADCCRPLYHFISAEGGLNDPNGLCHWQGRWHLFFQSFPPANPRPHWGHTVSDDLVHWRDLPYAIHPGPEDSCWSGSTWVEEERVLAMYHGHLLGNMVAWAGDPLLTEWTKVGEGARVTNPCPIWTWTDGTETMPGVGGNPVPAGAMNFVYDPCIWKQGDFYYSLSGGILRGEASGKRQRTEFLFRSADLEHWEYLHPFVEDDLFGLPGDDGGCPYFWPIGDRHILLHYSHMSGSHYILGHYDTERQKLGATGGGRFTFGPWYPGGVHAPTATPDGQGGLIALFNVNVGKPTQGWDQVMSLPRRLTLADDATLRMEPAGDLPSLRRNPRSVEKVALPANREVVLPGFEGNVAEILVEVDLGNSQMVELNVLRSPGREEVTRIAVMRNRSYVDWDRSDGWTRFADSRDSLLVVDGSYASTAPDVENRAPEMAPFYLAPGEKVQLRVFLDRSILEVFVNGRQAITMRVYPERGDSVGVSLRAQGNDATVERLQMWDMEAIWPRSPS